MEDVGIYIEGFEIKNKKIFYEYFILYAKYLFKIIKYFIEFINFRRIVF